MRFEFLTFYVQVQRFFFENMEFSSFFENWFHANAYKIEVDLDSNSSTLEQEMKLEYTELYNEFTALFEERVEGFLKQEGYSSLDLYRAIREKSEERPDSNAAFFGQVLVSSTSFDFFIEAMTEIRINQMHEGK